MHMQPSIRMFHGSLLGLDDVLTQSISASHRTVVWLVVTFLMPAHLLWSTLTPAHPLVATMVQGFISSYNTQHTKYSSEKGLSPGCWAL